MKLVLAFALILSVFTLGLPVSVHAGPSPVTADEQARWLRWVIPLPHRARIERKVSLKASQVRLRLREKPCPLEQSGAKLLAALFRDKAGVDPLRSSGSFEVWIGICDASGRLAGTAVPGAAELAKLPNREQAYLIRPLGANRMILTALDGPGVYYAARTFRQLLEGQFRGGEVTVPLASITDWPDIAERGEWGTSDVEWFAERKLNLVEVHAALKIGQDGTGVATISRALMERGRQHAVKVVPIITHLDYLRASGIYDRYPELKGVGKSAHAPVYDHPLALCFSKPKTTQILADWLSSLADHPGVSDINVWLSEYDGQCGCPQCTAAARQGRPQHVREVEAVARALRIARRKHPQLRVRILLTQGSYPVNDKVLAAVPPDVGVTYYCGGGRPRSTYNSSREPMIYPLLARYAAAGRWLGVYPQFTASYAVVCPWSGPQFIKYRMSEFAQKGLQCVCGYTVPNNRLHDFNVTAAAEWSWNVDGRSERDFAIAWATRRGLKDPERVGQWAEVLGPVSWDIYGAHQGAGTFLGSFHEAAGWVADRKKPVLGRAIWRYFESVEHMDRNLAACRQALALAERIGAPDLVAETRVVYGYTRMAKEIFVIGQLVAGGDLSSDETRAALGRAGRRLAEAGDEVVTALRQWERALGPPITARRYHNTLASTRRVVQRVRAALTRFGIPPGEKTK